MKDYNILEKEDLITHNELTYMFNFILSKLNEIENCYETHLKTVTDLKEFTEIHHIDEYYRSTEYNLLKSVLRTDIDYKELIKQFDLTNQKKEITENEKLLSSHR